MVSVAAAALWVALPIHLLVWYMNHYERVQLSRLLKASIVALNRMRMAR